jgi:spermidine/putrescine transport system substrate-binding protein
VAPGDDPGSLSNPYDIFWNTRYRTLVGIYDSYREAIALSLLHRGRDPNTHDRGEIGAAVDDLVAMRRAVDVAVTTDGAYDALPTGSLAVQQAWSGDVLSAKRFGHRAGTPSTAIRYTWPRGGVVGCDLSAICARGRNPVLAHAFLDHLLDEEVALENFSWNGYQPPVEAATPGAFAEPRVRLRRLVPPSAEGALLAPNDLATGSFLRPLPPAADATWRLEWQRFRRAASASGGAAG